MLACERFMLPLLALRMDETVLVFTVVFMGMIDSVSGRMYARMGVRLAMCDWLCAWSCVSVVGMIH